MKKLIVSAGLIAAGAASIQSVSAQTLDVVSPKAWNVAATLRGFYDDNYNISPNKKGSAGFEFSPSISYNLPLQQSDFGIRYTYGLYYYQDRQDLHINPVDQTHQVDLWLDHAINERWHLNVNDTFAVGQEPSLLGPPNGALSGQTFRANGNNIGNHAIIKLDTQWTKLFGTSLHYANDFYDYYDNSGATNGGPASLNGLLSRDEQNIGLDLNWTLSPSTKIFTGYTFGLVNYTGGEPISTSIAPPINYYSDDRNSMSHSLYIGLIEQFTPNLSFQGSVGAEYTDSYNDPDPLATKGSWSPTANISLTYTYTTGSYVQLGITQGENSTDVVQPGTDGSITQFQYTTGVFVSINHRITSKLMGTLIGRYNYSTYQGGAFESSSDNAYSLGANLSYQINRHFSTELGYNYDNLQTDVPGRGFTRNRVYLGVSASY